MMSQLSKLLGVDEAWLSLGISSDLPPKQREARNAVADGAVNVLAGLVQMNGGHCAFPSETDPRRDYVDLYAIVRGTQLSIHVSLGSEVSNLPMFCKFISLKQGLIDKHRVKKGQFFEITIHRSNGSFATGSDEWPVIDNMVDDKI